MGIADFSGTVGPDHVFRMLRSTYDDADDLPAGGQPLSVLCGFLFPRLRESAAGVHSQSEMYQSQIGRTSTIDSYLSIPWCATYAWCAQSRAACMPIQLIKQYCGGVGILMQCKVSYHQGTPGYHGGTVHG